AANAEAESMPEQQAELAAASERFLAASSRVTGDPGQFDRIEEVLNIRERILGPDHPQVADCLEVMGRVRQAESRHDVAIPLYARALAMRQQALGLEDSQTLLVQFWLADAYVLRNNDAEAETVFRALIKAALRTRGADDPTVLTGYKRLAAAMARQKRFAEAE